MWKSSPARSRESSWGGGKRNGSAGGEMKDGGGSGRGQQPPASTLEIATKVVTEERGTIESTKQNDRTSSSSSSSTSNSSRGGKLLQVLKRKVHVSRGASKASPDDRPSGHEAKQDAKEGSRRITSRSHDEVIVPAFRGQSSVDKLEGELLTLRRKLEKREAEMQRLANEVSTLRVTAIGSVEPQSQSHALSVNQAQEETSRPVNRSDSFRSDASQLSCLDFSIASTGNIKFEGNIKPKSTPKSSEPAEESGGQTASILSEAAAVGAPRLVEKPFNVSRGSILKEVRRTRTGSPSSHVQEIDIVDKHVEATKKSLHEPRAETSKPDYVEKQCLNHIGEDLKSPETVKDPEDGFSDVPANASRSPPSSTSSSFREEPDFTFPYLGPWSSDSNKSFMAEQAVSSKETNAMIPAAGVPKSSCAPAVVEVDEKSFVMDIWDGEEVDEKSLRVPLGNQTEDSFKQVASSKAACFRKEHKLAIEIPPPMEAPLKVLMNSCVMHELDKFSKTMKSLKREESLTSSKYPERISRSTSVLTPPHSVVPGDQALPRGGAQVRRHSPNWEFKERNVLEQPRPVNLSWSKKERDLESIVSTISKTEGPREPMAEPSRFDVENLPPSKTQGSSIYGTKSLKSPQSREYTRTTAGHDESSSPPASTLPPSAREFSPSRNSPRRQLSFDGPPGWKPDSGSGGLVRQTVSFDSSGDRSGGTINLEEEVRQCLEQSRQLLMSDASTSADEHSPQKPVSRETSFSVLALSRRRRSMEKSRPSPQAGPERVDGHETFSNVDHKTLKTQSGKVDVNNPTRVLTEQESEDYFTITPPSLTNTMEGDDKKHVQPSCESGAWDSNLRNLSSLPSRRSRFFIEANSTRFSQVA